MERNNKHALATQQVALSSANATLDAMCSRLAELEGEASDHSNNAKQECPDGFEENVGRVPNFFIKVDNVNLQARYVQRLPSMGLAQGFGWAQQSHLLPQALCLTIHCQQNHPQHRPHLVPAKHHCQRDPLCPHH